jgi:hypothetical protein
MGTGDPDRLHPVIGTPRCVAVSTKQPNGTAGTGSAIGKGQGLEGSTS